MDQQNSGMKIAVATWQWTVKITWNISQVTWEKPKGTSRLCENQSYLPHCSWKNDPEDNEGFQKTCSLKQIWNTWLVDYKAELTGMWRDIKNSNSDFLLRQLSDNKNWSFLNGTKLTFIWFSAGVHAGEHKPAKPSLDAQNSCEG